MGHRERLLEGAKKCLLDKGFARTTARDIVQASGTNLASIGYHFGSKDALLMAAMISAIDDWGDALETLPAGPTEGSPAAWVTAQLDSVAGSMPHSRALWVSTFEAGVVAEHEPALRKQLAEAQQLGRRGLAAELLGVPEDEVTDEQARRVGGTYLALISGVAGQHLIDPEHAPSAAELMETLRWLVSETPGAPARKPGPTAASSASKRSATKRSATKTPAATRTANAATAGGRRTKG